MRSRLGVATGAAPGRLRHAVLILTRAGLAADPCEVTSREIDAPARLSEAPVDEFYLGRELGRTVINFIGDEPTRRWILSPIFERKSGDSLGYS